MKKSLHRVTAIAAGCWLCSQEAAFAEHAEPAREGEAPVKSLGVVVVTGSQPTSLPTQIPTTIEGITGKEIEARINASDSEDALKYFPSLLVRKRYIGDYDHAVLSTRASGTGNSARSLVYADGILLSNLLGNGAFFTPRWGLVTPEEIERVDVLYGPFSAAYPGNSAGAVVDYVTRMPREFEAHAKLGAFTQNYRLYNTDDTFSGYQGSASLGNRNGDWSWWINVNRLDSEGHPLVFATRTVASGTVGAAGTPVTGAVLDRNRSNQPWYILGTSSQAETTQDHAKAKVAYQIAPDLRASYTLGWWDNETQRHTESYLRDAAGGTVTTGTVNIDGRSFALAAADFPQSRERLQHLIHGLSVKRASRGTFDWEVAASLYDYSKDLVRAPTTAPPVADAGGPGRITDQKGTGWMTLALKGIWRPDAGNVHVVDFGYQDDHYKLRNLVSNTSDWLGGGPESTNSAFRGDTGLRSLYAQDTWRFAPQWMTVLGLRLEHWRAWDGSTTQLAAPPAGSPPGTPSTLTTAIHPERDDTYVSPKAAIGYQATEDWVLKASAGRAVRFPTVSELFQGGVSAIGAITNGDPNLEPEASWTFELSSEHKLEAATIRATPFYEDTKGALYSQTNVTVTPNVTNIQNVDRIRTYGMELVFQGADVVLHGFDLSASVTYAVSKIVRNDKAPSTVDKYQPRIPIWRASLLATYNVNERLSGTLGMRYSGKQYNTLDNSDPNGFAYQGTSKFFTADARLRYRFARQWTAAFGVDNLNNYKYWNFHPYPQRTYLAELKFDL